ncbi:MAG: secretin and TonB N-terminal domain-containing protein [Muribaculaceae bacterium]|nr:secretin and TonB N-terminal domain-containing protein [Muribaculaceae bacterium]
MKKAIILTAIIFCAFGAFAQNITIRAVNRPASEVFRSIMEQTEKNFVYSSDLLKDMRITVDVKKKPLKKVLDDIFRDSDIEYKIKGNNVVLKKKKTEKPKKTVITKQVQTSHLNISDTVKVTMLQSLDVVSQSENHPLETAKSGVNTLSGTTIGNTPAILGEPDLIKALQILPGVSETDAGFSGMNVHGGNPDENMCMLDNVPLYQVEHFAGLFSPFNTDIVKYADFYKTSVPARFDGRLSSFLDVHLKNGNHKGHHGSGRLGLTSGAFNISGPIGEKTSYLIGLRRSWYDLLSIPALAIVNSRNKDEKTIADYHFMDFNARVDHRFSDRLSGFVNAYYGDDRLKAGTQDKKEPTEGYYFKEIHKFKWGNILAQTGVNYKFSDLLSAEFSAAYTGYFSGMGYDILGKEISSEYTDISHDKIWSSNYIHAFSGRGDFSWHPIDNSHLRFGASYTYHSFLPDRSVKENIFNDITVKTRNIPESTGASEMNAYIEDDWKISDRLHAELGIHTSLFHIDGKTKGGISPRFSFSYTPTSQIALKGAFSHTVQYVHRIDETYISLPCDRWVPVVGNFKPMTADKIGIGGYWQTKDGAYAVTLDGYWKFMNNLLDYRNEYYLRPQAWSWSERLTAGKGSSKGIDLMIEKKTGKFTGHISYSLAWADRRFADRNDGKPYPARCDHRHTVKVFANWDVSRKVTLSALWTGHSGNRFTFLPQRFDTPSLPGQSNFYFDDEVALKAPINNYQLPFYHRLDLSCIVKNKRGYWTFSLYNAYCHMNTVAIMTGYTQETSYTHLGNNIWNVETWSKPVFQKFKLIPIIPSFSYTWLF